MAKTGVMIVEDERIVGMHLKQQLSKLGYAVPAIVSSGEAALQQIKALRPDIVLMDIHIEGAMDGIEAASRIPEELHVSVIYLTAYSEEATLERARATKPYGYLLKPFSERELHATIQMALERRRADAAVRESAHRLEALVQARTRELERQTAQRVKAEQALMQVQKLEALGRLTGSVAHDFNNLLAAIDGALYLIDRRLEEGHAARKYVDGARDTARRGARVTSQLLAFSRTQRLDLAPTDVAAAIRLALPMISHAVGPTVALDLDLAEGEAWAMTAADQLELALVNLAVNARDAMPDGGTATLGLAVETPPTGSPGLVLWLRDSGVGMSEEVAARALEPFFTTKTRGEGTGLGLSQIYAFARQCGGDVTIDTALGAGTTVRITLPLMEQAPSIAAPGPAPGAVSAPEPLAASSGVRLLIVDDDDAVRQVLADGLRLEGFEVFEAASGAEGARMFAEVAPDAVVLDFAMPGMNGAEFARQVRAIRPDLPVAFCTGYAETLALEGVDDAIVLRKPIAVSAIGQAVADLVTRSRL